MRRSFTVAVAILLLAGAAAATAKPPPPSPAKCPLTPGVAPTGGDVQWAFTVSGTPHGSHPGVSLSYTHGRGSWTSGKANGTVCQQNSGAAGKHNVLFAARGAAHLSPRITRSGRLGVGLVVPVTVSKTDDTTCAVGTRGTVTLFSSYFEGHHDTIALHLGPGCAKHAYSFSGTAVHVLIARNGAQVNSA